MTTGCELSGAAAFCREELLRRNEVFTAYFRREAPRLAAACREMSRRFLAGGRLLAFGSGSAAATDAQHVAVEFVHPVIVGKRALPALDLGPAFERSLPVLLRPEDMVMGFAFPEPDPAVERALRTARERGALTFGLAAAEAGEPFPLAGPDPFVCQEVFEVLYHLLWETVHVFFEHRQQSHDAGAAAFLYPFLGAGEQASGAPSGPPAAAVEESMRQKVEEVNRLRAEAAETQSDSLAAAARALRARLAAGGRLIAFGNGGSATDAGDLVADCLSPPAGLPAVPAVSLAADPATLTAVANDVGADAIFLRQLIAQAGTGDAVVAVSTSGDSPNLLPALAEARRRGLLTVALTGYDGGKIARERLADHALVVRSDHVPRIQEVQASLYHVLRRCLAEPAGRRSDGA